jgi:hypothetical protein
MSRFDRTRLKTLPEPMAAGRLATPRQSPILDRAIIATNETTA